MQCQSSINDYKLCFVVSCVELLHMSKTLCDLLINTYISPRDKFMTILKVYAFGEDVDLINQLIESFAEDYIQVDKYSPYEFMCYYVVPKLWVIFGNTVEMILNEIYFNEFFIDRFKYSYKYKLSVLLKASHLDSAVKRYEMFLCNQNIKINKVDNRPFCVVTRNGHASLVFNFK